MARAIGRYELLRPLARGGMAEVFLARRRVGGVEKLLVIKRIRAERATNARFLELFVREARLSMSLAHQNIVPVFDFGRIGDQVFLAMERVEGKDLGSTLARNTAPMPVVVAAFIAAECCRALAYAHTRRRDGEHLGVVHRDVTPRNVLVSWSGEVKLTDFGIAAVTGEQTGRLVGTPAYMAPEQARGETVDARADLYALGLVLREAMTGTRARPGVDTAALVDAAKRSELLPWPAGMPAQLVAIVDRATAAMPSDRYADARAMLAALDEYIVAERAARTGDAPDRQLADWLARAWEGMREDEGDEIGEQPDVVSMFDEPGSETARSLAATADAEAPVIEPTPAHTPRPRRAPIVAMLVLALAGVVAFVVDRRGGDETVIQAPPDSAAAPDSASSVDAMVVDVLIEVDATVAVLQLDASPGHVDASVAHVDANAPRIVRDAARDATIAVLPTRKVRVHARPWATFTVDGGSETYETTLTIELTPGPHTLHFSNPELGVKRDRQIEVPRDRDIDVIEDLRR